MFRTTSLLDAAGNATVVIDANNNRVTTVFDALNRVSQVTDGRNNSRYTYYDAGGNVSGVKDALNNWTTFAYDDAGRQVNTFDATGNRTTTIYDKAGNATVTIDVLNNRTTYLFDGLNRSTVTIDALNNRTTKMFDAVGNLTALKDASNNMTTYVYDAANRKINEFDALGKRATFLYDAVGNLTRTLDRLGRRRDFQYTLRNEMYTEWWYDSLGNQIEEHYFTYDANSNLRSQAYSQTQSGTGYDFYYDALDRVTGIAEFGKLLTMTYDNVGNRKTLKTETGTTTYSYDAANNLTRTEFATTGYPTLRVDFNYNANNQLSDVTRYSDLAGSTKVAYSTYLYDALNRITQQDDRKGSDNSMLASYLYSYDTASRITSQTINGATNTFAYDTTNQLTGDGTTNVTYDATGNRNNGSYTTGTGNRLTNDGTYTYTYDDEGNLKTKANSGGSAVTWTYDYDHHNRLVSVEKRTASDGTLQLRVNFAYDVFGNRIKKEVDSNGDGGYETTERYWYDGWKTDHGRVGGRIGNENWDIWGDSGSDGTINTNYLRADRVDSLLARFGSGGSNAYWTLTDYQGSVRNVLDSAGVNKSTLAYDGYGKVTSESDPNYSGRYGYTGRERDVEIALQYNRARYYDPSTSRWISQDPLGFDAGDSNLYRYVKNRTPFMTDPSGLQMERDIPIIPVPPEFLESVRKGSNPGVTYSEAFQPLTHFGIDLGFTEQNKRLLEIEIKQVTDRFKKFASDPQTPNFMLDAYGREYYFGSKHLNKTQEAIDELRRASEQALRLYFKSEIGEVRGRALEVFRSILPDREDRLTLGLIAVSTAVGAAIRTQHSNDSLDVLTRPRQGDYQKLFSTSIINKGGFSARINGSMGTDTRNLNNFSVFNKINMVTELSGRGSIAMAQERPLMKELLTQFGSASKIRSEITLTQERAGFGNQFKFQWFLFEDKKVGRNGRATFMIETTFSIEGKFTEPESLRVNAMPGATLLNFGIKW